MSERWTKEEVRDKVDWEGGVAEALTGYGIDSSVLPDDTPDDIVEAWDRVYFSRQDVDKIERWLEED